LRQQLSLLAPQLVIPAPPGEQLTITVHEPLTQFLSDGHATALSHWPPVPHACVAVPEQRWAPCGHSSRAPPVFAPDDPNPFRALGPASVSLVSPESVSALDPASGPRPRPDGVPASGGPARS